ncbi:hypothetical protein GHT06_003848 [Daphnia sinensis]|uniref:Uncharacterized protein n=1 Tax=Daphnia sinensis TaxID=1820382 RepID=A0AAD5PKS8_9CRUS|nr:hypothetical protein GHT06_003848 [Daphnia sinensis]
MLLVILLVLYISRSSGPNLTPDTVDNELIGLPTETRDLSFKTLPNRNVRIAGGVSDGINKEAHPLHGLNTSLTVQRFDPGVNQRPYLPHGHLTKKVDRQDVGQRRGLENFLSGFARDGHYIDRVGESNPNEQAILKEHAPKPDTVISKREERPYVHRNNIPGLPVNDTVLPTKTEHTRRGIKTYDWSEYSVASYPELPIMDAHQLLHRHRDSAQKSAEQPYPASATVIFL